MDLLTLVRTEALTVRRNVGLFVVLLILIPATLTGVTGVYDRTIPEDVPVGVVPAAEETTENELAAARTGVDFFATPVAYDSPERAREALAREEVYLVLEVPPDLMDADAEVTFTVVTDRTMVPFENAADLSVSIMDSRLDGQLPSSVSVEHERLDDPRVLTEYLIPVVLIAFVLVYGLVFVPYQVRSERRVLDRLQTTSRLETVLAAKFLVYGALTVVPTAIAGVVATRMGYDIAALSPFTLATVLLTFVFVTATGLAVLFALQLRRSALFVDVGLVFVLLSLSSVVFPAGFFSPTRKVIARVLPTHYATVTTRSAMLRDAPVSLYADYLLCLVVSAVVALIALELAVVSYRRRR